MMKETNALLESAHILTYRKASWKLIKVGSPFFASAAVVVIGNFSTAFMVAKLLEPNALAASGLASALQNLMTGTLAATLNGVSIVAGKHIGEGALNDVGKVLHQGWIGASLLSIPAICVMLANKPIFLLFGQNPEIVELTNKFFLYYCFSLPAMTMLTCNRRIALATENAWISFGFDLLYQALYVGLCYTLMTQSTLGFSALGLANLLSSWTIFSLSTTFMFFSKRFEPYALTSFTCSHLLHGLGDLIKMGISFGIKVGIELAIVLWTNIVIGHSGVDKEAANAAASQFMSFVLIPIFSLMDTIATLVSQARSSGNIENARKFGYSGILLGSLVATLGLVLSESIPNYLCRYFISSHDAINQKIIDIAISLLRINGISMLADSISNLSVGALSGYYDIFIPTIIMILVQVLVIPSSYILEYMFWKNPIFVIGSRGFASGLCSLLLLPRLVWKTESELLNIEFPDHTNSIEPNEDEPNPGCWKKATLCLPWKTKHSFYHNPQTINDSPNDVIDHDELAEKTPEEEKYYKCQCVLF